MNMNLQRLAPQSPDIHPATTAVMLRNMIQRLKIRKIEGADGKYRVFALVFSFPASGSMCMPIKSRGLCSDCRSMASILQLKRLELEILFMVFVLCGICRLCSMLKKSWEGEERKVAGFVLRDQRYESRFREIITGGERKKSARDCQRVELTRTSTFPSTVIVIMIV